MFDNTSIEKIKDKLIRNQQTVAVTESVTGGFIAAALSTATDAMKFFQGGMTLYNLGQKVRHLNIDPIHAASSNCVSSKMAEDMAISVANEFTSHWGLSITGYASPVPQSDNKVFAYAGIAFEGEIKLSQKLEPPESDAIQVQLYYTNELLKLFSNLID